ncbi:MAG: hypothetical protein APR62_02730 [Smithella sp. SDB]|nr:MAG: hypothetical protein APR62_02730 [Smithella sp. SDB]
MCKKQKSIKSWNLKIAKPLYCFFLAIILLIIPLNAESLSGPEISFSSNEMDCGSLILVMIKNNGTEEPLVTWMKKKISLVYCQANDAWVGFIGADLNQKAGLYKVVIQLPGYSFEKSFCIRINDKDYGTRRLKLPRKKVELDADSVKRAKREAAVIRSIWSADNTLPKWDGAFLMPIDGDIVGTFGKRSIINNLRRAPHTGVDQAGNKGDPVRAINNGKVILIANHFFSGNSLYLDHGGGIISMYFHLDKILVDKEDDIKKGEVIGILGATGRVTAPHLHWGVRINGARINPLTLIELSNTL